MEMMEMMVPEGFAALMENSYQVRNEIDLNAEWGVSYQSFVPYVPIEATPDTGNLQKELLDGMSMKNGTCGSCFMVKTASGSCNCTD